MTYRVGNFANRMWVKRNHSCPDITDFIARHGTHTAQILGDDYIRSEFAQQSLVNEVQLFVGLHCGAYLGID